MVLPPWHLGLSISVEQT